MVINALQLRDFLEDMINDCGNSMSFKLLITDKNGDVIDVSNTIEIAEKTSLGLGGQHYHAIEMTASVKND